METVAVPSAVHLGHRIWHVANLPNWVQRGKKVFSIFRPKHFFGTCGRLKDTIRRKFGEKLAYGRVFSENVGRCYLYAILPHRTVYMGGRFYVGGTAVCPPTAVRPCSAACHPLRQKIEKIRKPQELPKTVKFCQVSGKD